MIIKNTIESMLKLGKITLNEIQRADKTPGTPEETLETAGCTGGCEAYDEKGLPDCSRCSQGKD